MPQQAQNNEFTNPTLEIQYGLYPMRKALLTAIATNMAHLTGKLVDVGCGEMPYREMILNRTKVDHYIGVDWADTPYHRKITPDFFWDGKSLPFENDFADSCIATELFEHLSNPVQVATDIHRILKPGGQLLITVPVLWPFHEVPFDEYRYTPFSLRRILREAGFQDEKIQITATGGWYACLAQTIAHVITMEVMNPKRQHRLKRLSIPLIRWLLKKDRIPTQFTNHSMALGLCALVSK